MKFPQVNSPKAGKFAESYKRRQPHFRFKKDPIFYLNSFCAAPRDEISDTGGQVRFATTPNDRNLHCIPTSSVEFKFNVKIA